MKLYEALEGKKKVLTPSQINRPTYLLNFPQSLSTAEPNNALMKSFTPDQLKVDHEKANDEFMELNKFIIESGGVVYLLPSVEKFQDQVYVSNLGIYLPHLTEENVIIVANFRTPPRRGEEKVGEELFDVMGYTVHNPPEFFEGQAELRYIRDNIYVGGWGQRSSKKVYKWMQDEFDMIIPTVETKYPEMYHLDCMMLRLTEDKVLCPHEALSKEELKNLQQYFEVVDVPLELAMTGSFNGVRVSNRLMYGDPNKMLVGGKPGPDKDLVKRIMQFHDKIEDITGLERKFFDLTEFERSGADLGCMIMHLNYHDY